MASTTTNRRQGLNTGAAVKVACKAATTANITLSGEQTIDGIACTDGDRVFVRTQTTASQNGIYEVSTSTWQRAKDFDGTFDVVEGTLIPVSRGSTYGGQVFRVTNTGTITIGTTSLTFELALNSGTMAFTPYGHIAATNVQDAIEEHVDDLAASTGASLVGFTQSGTGATTRTVQDKLREFVSVKDFGAVGDGSTDDTSAIQKALNTGQPVYMPTGTYKITDTLDMNAAANIGQRLFGAGPVREDLGTGTNKTIIQPSSAVSVAIFLDGSSVGSRGCELADFSIDMTNMTDASTGIGVQTQDSFSNEFRNLTFLNQGTNKRSFKFLDGSLLTKIENCRGTIVELNGVDLADAVVALTFLNCDFDSYIMESAAQINVIGGAVQGSLDKFDLTDKVEGLTIIGVDIEGTGTFLKCGTNITQINQHSNYFDGFSGTFSSGSWTNGGGLFYRETNSWTPTLAFGGAAVDLTYSNQGASATREGNRVHCTLDFIIGSNGSSSGAAVISGLPYAGSASFNQDFAINVNNGTLTGQLFGRIAPGASTIALFVTNDGATAAATEANITDNCTMRAVFTYMVD